MCRVGGMWRALSSPCCRLYHYSLLAGVLLAGRLLLRCARSAAARRPRREGGWVTAAVGVRGAPRRHSFVCVRACPAAPAAACRVDQSAQLSSLVACLWVVLLWRPVAASVGGQQQPSTVYHTLSTLLAVFVCVWRARVCAWSGLCAVALLARACLIFVHSIQLCGSVCNCQRGGARCFAARLIPIDHSRVGPMQAWGASWFVVACLSAPVCTTAACEYQGWHACHTAPFLVWFGVDRGVGGGWRRV